VDQTGIGIVGAGYVGLVTGATLAHIGHLVVCVDKDKERISVLKEGRMPFYEPGLQEMVSRSVHHERLSFTDSAGLTRLAGEADAIFICVDTPKGRMDLPTSRASRRSREA
jgi:UDPglucose 6-dehydrogenase